MVAARLIAVCRSLPVITVCSIISELSLKERNAIRAIADGEIDSVPLSVVFKLKQLHLLYFDRQSFLLLADVARCRIGAVNWRFDRGAIPT